MCLLNALDTTRYVQADDHVVVFNKRRINKANYGSERNPVKECGREREREGERENIKWREREGERMREEGGRER